MNDSRPGPQPDAPARRSGAGRRRRPRRGGRGASNTPKGPSPATLESRRAAMPQVTYPAALPVSARKDEIAEALRDHQVLIVAGETGSGKTTQLPKICLELGLGINGTIGHTQPRRIAARTVAERIAEELGTQVGGAVGYQVRFTDNVSPSSLIKVMTDGILLAEIQRDPMLRRYEVIIIDEAHERSLNIDFLLGYLHQLLPQRPDLKVIITSATIDSARFAEHFGTAEQPAPVIEVSGRTYPVQVRYRPLLPDEEDEEDRADGVSSGEEIEAPEAICAATDELMALGSGDILVFCSGEREIRDSAEALRQHLDATPQGRAVEILPLYARLSAAEQHRVFAAHSARRIVLATNIAETSLTVPGVRYVIDPGTARISRYSARTKVQRLPIEAISQASANQRSGRCGRVADGVAIRLYSQEDFEARPEFTEPEILRTSLASVILQMTALGLGDVTKFGFVDPPDTRAVRDGVTLLTELGAIRLHDDDATSRRELTKVGRTLARLPIDPRLGRMLIEADRQGCMGEVLVIVAALSIQDVRERPAESQQQADAQHRRFADESSDFLSILRLWDYLRTQRAELSSSAFRRMCRAEYLHFLRVREWQDVLAQLRQMLKHLGISTPHAKNPGEADADAVHQAILSGLLTHIGSWDERRREYVAARGARFVIFPGSHLAKKNPDWVMAAELVETSRLFGRTVARIQPEWVEKLAEHLIKRTYSEPYWSTRQGAGMAKEKVLLYGIPLVADRPVPFARVDKVAAREMFIREALVDGQWRSHHAFVKHNAGVLEQAEELQARQRRRDLVMDETGLYDFYDERVPEQVVTARHFDSWWKQAKRDDPHLLDLSLELVLPADHELDSGLFPDTWTQGDLTLPLSYQFEPGTAADGVTVHVPIEVLPQLQPEGFDWLVPGLLEELSIATIRSLPKPVRKHLVPAPDTAGKVRALLPDWSQVAPAQPGAPSFHEAFGSAVQQVKDVEVPDDAWAPERLPDHLRVTFEVHDAAGAVLGSGQDLIALQRQLAKQTAGAVRTAVGQAFADAGRAVPTPPATGTGRAKNGGADRSGQRHGGVDNAGGSGQPGSGAPAPQSATALTPGLNEVSGLRAWPKDTSELPMQISATGSGGLQVRGYPALVAEKDGVSLRVLTDPDARDRAHPAGVRELIAQGNPLATQRVSSRWTGRQALTLAASPYSSTEALVTDLVRAAVASLTEQTDLGSVRTRARFEEVATGVYAALEDEVHRIAGITSDVLTAAAEVDRTITATTSLALLDVLTDVRTQREELVTSGFLAATPSTILPHLPRYLRAAVVRLEKAAQNPHRDADLAWQLRELTDAWWSMASSDSADPQVVSRVRWMLQELRVSFFAQNLGTSEPVSAKRIRKAMAP